jgi:hypothetical protein
MVWNHDAGLLPLHAIPPTVMPSSVSSTFSTICGFEAVAMRPLLSVPWFWEAAFPLRQGGSG